MERKGILAGEGVRFERIRRITGYLVGSVERFNDAKRAEVGDRVKHAAVSAPRRNAEPTSGGNAPARPSGALGRCR